MKSFVIRNVGDDVYRELKSKSKIEHKSMNKLLLSILEEHFGKKKKRTYHDLDHLFGQWTEEEALTFDRDTEDLRHIDEEIWK